MQRFGKEDPSQPPLFPHRIFVLKVRFLLGRTRALHLPLRANKSETIEWLKFTLEGVGERTHGYAFEDTAF